ncbi:MAG: type II toxin-antitoxin system RelE/ParE family toxin [Planctomycetota bacterium]
MKIAVNSEAAEELAAAAVWYEAEQPGLGADFLREALRAVAVIAEGPTAWPMVNRKRNVRKFLLARFPYAVYYVPREDEILVLAVAHGSRRPGYWRGRLGG